MPCATASLRSVGSLLQLASPRRYRASGERRVKGQSQLDLLAGSSLELGAAGSTERGDELRDRSHCRSISASPAPFVQQADTAAGCSGKCAQVLWDSTNHSERCQPHHRHHSHHDHQPRGRATSVTSTTMEQNVETEQNFREALRKIGGAQRLLLVGDGGKERRDVLYAVSKALLVDPTAGGDVDGCKTAEAGCRVSVHGAAGNNSVDTAATADGPAGADAAGATVAAAATPTRCVRRSYKAGSKLRTISPGCVILVFPPATLLRGKKGALSVTEIVKDVRKRCRRSPPLAVIGVIYIDHKPPGSSTSPSASCSSSTKSSTRDPSTSPPSGAPAGAPASRLPSEEEVDRATLLLAAQIRAGFRLPDTYDVPVEVFRPGRPDGTDPSLPLKRCICRAVCGTENAALAYGQQAGGLDRGVMECFPWIRRSKAAKRRTKSEGNTAAATGRQSGSVGQSTELREDPRPSVISTSSADGAGGASGGAACISGKAGMNLRHDLACSSSGLNSI